MTDSVKQSDEPQAGAQLKEFLKDISAYIDNASEDQKRELLSLFQDTRLLSLLDESRQGGQREHSRKPCSTQVTFATEDRVFKNLVTNISSGGVFIETPEALSVGEEIALIFSSSGNQGPVKITGKVVWRVSKGIGVKFATANSDLEAIIASL